ncbi:GGDEF domain-containing protein [Sphingomonas nostoxanthinifaciens]|uniref:GGDEF domain-containing protein n=1 Tax=Sphingomonas nostoxanthinifaciens TaxID=2872652 RepID=UPI001CC1F070|nr:diguanylate cyclase [Sphingomonas nostoxanthinifaciens]UAK24397.1 diguanylate cyclase [Sphingomonas nostoxanthinifaciens]
MIRAGKDREPPQDPLRGGAELLRRATALAGIGAWSCELVDNRLTWTDGTYDIFGIPLGATIDRRDTVAMYQDESRALMELVRREAIARRGAFTIDAEIMRLDGERRWMRLSGDVVTRGGRVVQLYGLKQDITEQRRQLDALKLLAESDALTGLANRRAFQERLLDMSGARLRLAGVGALILIDVDGFKMINDRYGHGAGDACLRSFAARLANAFARSAMVARIGGDEFAIVALDDGDPGRLLRRTRGLLRDLSAPIVWQDRLLAVSASAGLAWLSDSAGLDGEALFADADRALYAAKRGGRNCMRVGRPVHRSRITR